MRRALYDLLYRVGAPWDGPPRPELVTLVERGVLTPAHLPPGRAIDLGCGTGANIVYLAAAWLRVDRRRLLGGRLANSAEAGERGRHGGADPIR